LSALVMMITISMMIHTTITAAIAIILYISCSFREAPPEIQLFGLQGLLLIHFDDLRVTFSAMADIVLVLMATPSTFVPASDLL
ncbi:MAG: hypothetical protein ACN2B6_00990, partial [Rickettsiales bacterium]